MTRSTTYLSFRALLQLLPYSISRLLAWPWENMYVVFVEHVRDSIEQRPNILKEEIHAEALALLIGGIDPTTHTLTTLFHLLMLHPECYQEAVNEVRSVFPNIGCPIWRHVFESPCEWYPPLPSNIPDSLYSPRDLLWPTDIGYHKVLQRFPINGEGVPLQSTVPDRSRKKSIQKPNIPCFRLATGKKICMGRLTIVANILRDYDLKLPEDYESRRPSEIDPRTRHPKPMDMAHVYGS